MATRQSIFNAVAAATVAGTFGAAATAHATGAVEVRQSAETAAFGPGAEPAERLMRALDRSG